MDTVASIESLTPPIQNPTYGQSQDNTEELPVERNEKFPCIFCGYVQKKIGDKKLYPSIMQTVGKLESIKKMAVIQKEAELLTKLNSCKSVPYHSSCLISYEYKYQKNTVNSSADLLTQWHENRKAHKIAFEALSAFITEEVIKKDRVLYLVDLLSRYKILLAEQDGTISAIEIKHYRVENLETKIMSTFADRLTIETSYGPHHKRIIYKRNIDVSLLASKIAMTDSKNNTKLVDLAYELRNEVKNVESRKLPENLTVDDVLRGECEIPDKLFEFMCNLVQGPDIRRKISEDDNVKIKSLCSDIIYIITKGRIKPAKHLALGLAVKSITSSRKVLTILNRYGHTVGYNLAEELETELTYSAYKDDNLIPTGIKAVNGLSTHVAFDNFDRYVDTCSGKDTLHDTVGIIYQFDRAENIPRPGIEVTELSLFQQNQESKKNDNEIAPPPRKRRKYEEIPREIRPFNKKPTSKMILIPSEEIVEAIADCRINEEMAIERDLLWAISLSQINYTPMWLGYNCKTILDSSTIQKVDYLPPINASPTSYSVVHETLCLAKDISQKCNQEEIIVTYDLAIAKMAMQIQRDSSPDFDNIFINLGAFHTEMAFFKATGKFIDSCGIMDVLVQAEVLAGGSVNGFITGKHFNRCKRIHPLISGALQTLHFKQFISENDCNCDLVYEDLVNLMNSTNDVNEKLVLPDSLQDVLQDYKSYCDLTLTGHHGKTAQFFLQYVMFIDIFLRFSRSIRTNDYYLYIDSIFNMANLFFVMNQPNYARWSVMYLNNLVDLKRRNSPLFLEFELGAFGVKRTKKNLARAPVDLTLEQTINADAGNTLTGVSHFTNSISARQRWALSHSIRTKVISKVLDDIHLSKKDDTSHSLQSSRIEKDRKALTAIIETIKKNVNPFDKNIDNSELFNISNGKAVSFNVADFLLNVDSLGHEQKVNFIDECAKTPGRFEKPLKRNKILNFASQCIKRNQKSLDGTKKALLKMERDIFGRLLAIALEKKVDMEYCLTFPLAPAPPALFDCSGEMYKTDKSALAKILKSHIDVSSPPTQVNVEIIDGFYYLHLLGSRMPQSFEKISETILIKLCFSKADEIHLVFDRHITPSIKDCERRDREAFDIPYTINGPSQTRPSDFLKSLKNFRFKQALVEILSDHWENDYFSTILQNKKVFITVGEKCFSYYAEGNRVIKTEEKDLECQHEEADTRIIFHMGKVHPNSTILVKATDTDVLVIILGNIHKFPNAQIWLLGTSKKEQTYTDCTKLASVLGHTLCLSLPAFHAFTGSDYTSAFRYKGKVKPFNILKKNETFQEMFACLTDVTDVYDEDKVDAVQEFTGLIYGIKNCKSVNNARFQIFQKTYANTKNNEKFLRKIKGFDSSQIPPCWKSLKNKMLRTIYINCMWKNATNSDCVTLKAEDCGWLLDNILKPRWFNGDPTPLNVDDILSFNNTSDMAESSNEQADDLQSDIASSDSESE